MASARSWTYSRGLHEIADGCFAWLQPDGSWGWSNAGLVTDPASGASLLVDTLFDLALTGEMLAAMRRATPAAEHIDAVVNTHANGDHCYGNALLRDCEIIASKASAEEMDEVPPQLLASLLEAAPQLGAAGAFLARIFAPFSFRGIEHVAPTRTFEGELEWRVGGRRLRFLQVGPAHTRGDVLVHAPEQRVIFTGDILFIDGTPILWEGPVDNWIRACEWIESLDVDAVVPGHGPISPPAAARSVREYLAFLRDEAHARFAAGLSAADAARDIDLGAYADWRDAERVAVNVDTLYRGFAGGGERTPVVALFALMAELAQRGRGRS
jgi:glyoxylase-like metal-dependent hydrolase (beta-lactamase superfamily II)